MWGRIHEQKQHADWLKPHPFSNYPRFRWIIQFTLLGCTARLKFSIHLSLSAADRHEKHLLPVEVVTCNYRLQLSDLQISALRVLERMWRWWTWTQRNPALSKQSVSQEWRTITFWRRVKVSNCLIRQNALKSNAGSHNISESRDTRGGLANNPFISKIHSEKTICSNSHHPGENKSTGAYLNTEG